MLPASVDELRLFCGRPNQRFVCSPAGDHGQTRAFCVTHRLRPAAPISALGEFEENLFTEQLVDFYRYHDGAVLFKDLDSDEAGLELLPLASWKKLHAAIIEMYGEFRDECDLEWLDHFVAFAEAPHSGNYFIMPTDGPSAGQVIYCDHDGPNFQTWAPDFHSFLRQFMDDPADQIYQLGCFLRFREQESEVQWCPERYFAGDELAW